MKATTRIVGAGGLILILLSACAAPQLPVVSAPMPVHHESTRTLHEIQEGFDRNKGRLIAIYNQSTRENFPGDGVIVFSFGVAPDGSMTHCEIVSSTLHYENFEQALLRQVATINFGARDVPPFEMAHYPVAFHFDPH